MKSSCNGCDALLESSLNAFEQGKSWAASPLRMCPSKEQIVFWDELIREWMGNRALPLLVRKFTKNRGSVIHGANGRKFIPVDNSPAQWLYVMACDNQRISLTDIDFLLRKGELPVAMMMYPDEKRQATYPGLLRNRGTGKFGWKLAHIGQIGKGLSKSNISTCSEIFLEEHFRKFMSPSNMFVIPKKYAGLAEDFTFLDGFISGMNAPAPIAGNGNDIMDDLTEPNQMVFDTIKKTQQKPLKIFILHGNSCNKNTFEKYLIDNNLNRRECLVYVKIIYEDGGYAEKLWRVYNFKESTDLNGNLNSGFLRGWRKKGIRRIELKIP